MNAAIDLSDAAVERGGHRVVHDIALAFEPGHWFGLIGANGSGKTSLLRAVCGRLPFASGTCRIGGEDLAHDRAARAARIGFAPPSETLPGALRARDVLALVGGDLDRALANIGDLGAALGLEPLLGRWIADCSAGMRQRVAIASAFAAGHRIVILDEPFNWVDPVAAYDVRQVLRTMVEGGLTLVTALHDLATLTQSCDAGAVLAGGGVVLRFDADALRAATADLAGFERRMTEALRASS
jgi:ABC-2 type transport system ATP-binding protein